MDVNDSRVYEEELLDIVNDNNQEDDGSQYLNLTGDGLDPELRDEGHADGDGLELELPDEGHTDGDEPENVGSLTKSGKVY